VEVRQNSGQTIAFCGICMMSGWLLNGRKYPENAAFTIHPITDGFWPPRYEHSSWSDRDTCKQPLLGGYGCSIANAGE